jgi:hypothetical protein
MYAPQLRPWEAAPDRSLPARGDGFDIRQLSAKNQKK